jgi:predicted naringenin-chalcone synthase
MIQPAILGIGTAVPENSCNQMEICDSLESAFNNRRAPAVFRATEIDKRHIVQDSLDWYAANPGNEARLKAYISHAPGLGVEAIRKALDQAQLTPADIDTFIVASSTGVDTPGLDVKIAESLNMSPYLRRAALVGMGCQAFMPSLHQATTTVLARPKSKVLVLTLELCSLHIQHERSIKNILGSALFADGASAAIVGNNGTGGLRLLDSLTYSDYQTQEEMSFHPGETGYKIYLSGKIPELLRVQVPPLVEQVLSRNNLQLNDIKHWAVHPGGMRIVDFVEQALELDGNELQYSRSVLREYGNMSSATLLFVLERIVLQARPSPGDFCVLLGFGPGLTIEVGLVQW